MEGNAVNLSKMLSVVLSFVFAAEVVFSAGDTPIANLKLTSNANGNGQSFTNLNVVATTNLQTRRIGVDTATNATGNGWVAIGDSAGNYAAGNTWIALGSYAGYNSGPEDFWVAIGYYAGEYSKGRYATSIGADSGLAVTGNYWAAVGHYAGRYALGNNWAAYGQQAGQYAFGNYWTAIGLNAGANSYGDSWTTVGRNAGRSSTGTFWNAVGNYAGQYANGSYNTYIGSWAGKNANESDAFFFDSFQTDPGPSYNPSNSILFLKAGTVGDAHIGRPDGRVYLRGLAKYKDSEIVNGAVLQSNIANEITVDVSGFGQFTSITQALAYVDSIHATNATLYVNMHIVAGRYNENPVFKGYTVVRGDVRRTRIYGNTKVTGGPTFFDGFDFRTTDGSTPLTFDGITVKSVLSNCYILNDFNKDEPSYGIIMTNSSNYVQINTTELYVRNSSATANAKAILIMSNSGGFELVNMRLKTSSSGSYENEYLGWFWGTAAVQVECCEYQVLHDLNGSCYIGDVTSGIEWMDSSAVNNENRGNFLYFFGAGKNNVNFYGKEVGALKVNGPLSLSTGVTNVNLKVITDGTNTYQVDMNTTTNQYVVSPTGSNNVSAVWRGSYDDYLKLTNKNDSTTYFITDDDTVYDTMGLYQEIDNYNIIPSGTTKIVVDPTKTVYFVNVSDSTTIDFDLSGLNFTNKVATFEVWVAYLNVSASITWGLSSPDKLYWVSGTPTFTTISTNYFVMRAFATNSIHANLKYAK